MVEFGRQAIFGALGLSVLTTLALSFGVAARNRIALKIGQLGIALLFLVITAASGVLLNGLLTHNFQIAYVANYSSTDLSTFYLVTAFWAGQEGSLLFWLWLISFFTVIVLAFNLDEEDRLAQTALSVLTAVQVFFLIVVAIPANPFVETAKRLSEGFGLNPLLQHLMMIIHPPTLFIGYSAFAVPFAFAIASLLLKRNDDYWIKKSRWWTLFAWLLLGGGIVLGAAWAYEELGWGGYWAWDPVENSSLLPWLVGTALIHSISVYVKRKQFRIWTFSLVIVTFILCIYGTFLTRSGIASVHSFGKSVLGYYFLTFIAVALVFSFGLLWSRRHALEAEQVVESLLSQEGGYLVNNIIFVMITIIVFYGTTLPLFTGGGQQAAGSQAALTVSQDFYNRFSSPLAFLMLFVLALCPLLSWRDTPLEELKEKMRSSQTHQMLSGLALLFGGLSLALAAGDGLLYFFLNILSRLVFQSFFYSGRLAMNVLGVAGFLVCLAAFFAVLYAAYHEISVRQRQASETFGAAFGHLLAKNKHRYGGFLAHIGVAIVSIGIIGSAFYPTSIESWVMPGNAIRLGNVDIKLDTLSEQDYPNRQAVAATLQIFQNGIFKGTVKPSVDYYRTEPDRPTREVVIWRSFFRDLYFALAEFESDGRALIQVYNNPMISWIWTGSFFLVAGTIFAMFDEKLKVGFTAEAPPPGQKKRFVTARKVKKRPKRRA